MTTSAKNLIHGDNCGKWSKNTTFGKTEIYSKEQDIFPDTV